MLYFLYLSKISLRCLFMIMFHIWWSDLGILLLLCRIFGSHWSSCSQNQDRARKQGTYNETFTTAWSTNGGSLGTLWFTVIWPENTCLKRKNVLFITARTSIDHWTALTGMFYKRCIYTAAKSFCLVTPSLSLLVYILFSSVLCTPMLVAIYAIYCIWDNIRQCLSLLKVNIFLKQMPVFI